MAESSVDKQGFLEKRQRGLKHPNTDRLKFQRRYFKLDNEFLRYYKDKVSLGANLKQDEPHFLIQQPSKPSTEPKGKIPIGKIKVIEVVDKSVFGKDFCFQVISIAWHVC